MAARQIRSGSLYYNIIITIIVMSVFFLLGFATLIYNTILLSYYYGTVQCGVY